MKSKGANMNTNTIKKSFSNDFQINHQIKVLNAIGVNVKFTFQFINENLTIVPSDIKFSNSFIKTKRLQNNPSINFEDFTIIDIELFKLKKPNKELLAKNAISSGFSLKISNFEKIVDNIYSQSLKSIEQEEEKLTKQFTNVLNQNLVFLKEAISIFCSLHNRKLR